MKNNKYTNKHKDELGLEVPKDYFKTSKADILNKIKEENILQETPVFTIKHILPYAIAASFIIFIGLTFFNTKTIKESMPSVVEGSFDFSDNDTSVNALFIDENNIDSYVDSNLEDTTLADIEAIDNAIDNDILNLLFETDTLIDNQLDNLVFDTII